MKSLALLALGALAFSNSWAFNSTIVITPKVPVDIPGGAENASVMQAARFAWQEFIALNWPANTRDGKRDVPAKHKIFGDPAFKGPLVWHTFRHKVEAFPGQGDPYGYDPNKEDFGYSTLPPVYTYGSDVGTGGNGVIPACPGQIPIPFGHTAYINLDEVSQIGLDYMFAGVAPDNVPPDYNSNPQLMRFLAKVNKTYFEYVVNEDALVPGGDPLYTHPSATDCDNDPTSHTYCVARENFLTVSTGDGSETTLETPIVALPTGTILAKSAFRPLTKKEEDSGRFYVTRVRYYEDNANNGEICYREAYWGLVALHIIHKTPTAPNFVFATFEQADNLLTKHGRRVETPTGLVVNKGGQRVSTTPGLVYSDDPPMLTIDGDENDPADYCTHPGKRLFYLETNPPNDGYICQNFRDHSIPLPVRWVNGEAQRAIKKYSRRNGIRKSPFQFYKLVNVQPHPFDQTEIQHGRFSSFSNRSEAVYYLSNNVVETDYSLQNFSGRLTNGLTSDFPANFFGFNGRETYQNVLTFDDLELVETSNMGGCMGCHGVAQNGGNDFSFVLGGGRVATPEAPEITPPGTSNPAPDVPD